jgi:hypothetical protein
MSAPDSVFAELLDGAENDLIVLVKSYFDESYDKELLCVAGYMFTSRQARELDEDWRKMLIRYQRLPYFRMSACNAHEHPFDRLTDGECIKIATEAIGLINKYASIGFAVTVDQAAFSEVITSKGVFSTSYELCSWLSLVCVKTQADRLFPLSPMSFFFEAGFQHQGVANKMMNRIFKIPSLRKMYRYKAHAFVDKTECRPIQAGDLLAWQWYKNATRQAKGLIKRRGDLAALLAGSHHYTLHLDAERLQRLVEAINIRAGSSLGNEIAGLAIRDPSNPIFPKRSGESGDAEAYEKLRKTHGE